MRGQPAYAWEPDKGAYVGVMKRNGRVRQDIVWFRAENCYVFHVMNAWEEGNRIVADVMQFEEAPLFPHPDGSPTDPAKVARAAVPLDLRSLGQYRPLHANLSRRSDRRISAHRRSPRRTDEPPWLVRLRQLRDCRCSARSPASCMSTARDRGSASYLLAAGRHHFRAGIRRPRRGCRRGRRLAAGGGLARARKPQRPRGLQRHRRRGRPGRAGASRPSRARRLSRQLGRERIDATLSFRGAR